ncbi:MAG: hypothetical protein ACHQRK_03770 [Gemmatimonadales bacterium]|jgi:hypothetical protein
MVDRPTDRPSFPKDRFENPEAALGGADAVEKTTFVTGKGTDPDAQKAGGTPSARVQPAGGQGATWAILVFLVVGAVLVYLLGFGQ